MLQLCDPYLGGSGGGGTHLLDIQLCRRPTPALINHRPEARFHKIQERHK